MQVTFSQHFAGDHRTQLTQGYSTAPVEISLGKKEHPPPRVVCKKYCKNALVNMYMYVPT